MDTNDTQRLEEQVAYMERELEKQREEMRALWEELSATRKVLSRVLRRLERAAEEPGGTEDQAESDSAGPPAL